MDKAKNIGQLPLRYGKVSRDDLEEGLKKQKDFGPRLGETLLRLGKVTMADIEWILSKQLDVPFVLVEYLGPDATLISRFPSEHYDSAWQRLAGAGGVQSFRNMLNKWETSMSGLPFLLPLIHHQTTENTEYRLILMIRQQISFFISVRSLVKDRFTVFFSKVTENTESPSVNSVVNDFKWWIVLPGKG